MGEVSMFKLKLAYFLQSFCRYYPFYSGCGKLANSKAFCWALTTMPDKVWAKISLGPQIHVPIHDHVGRSLFYFGDLDPKVTWICRQLLRPGDTVIDIGANIGLITLEAARLVGENGKVHSFEPQSGLVDLLRTSLKRNNYTHVMVHNIALGEKNEELDLFIPENNRGEASLIREVNNPGKIQSVSVKRASTYLSELDLPPIRLVKIDVEGFEEHVIRGALPYFESHPPDAIIFEMNGNNLPLHQQPTVQMLNTIGYRFFETRKVIFNMRLFPVDLHNPTNNSGHDILAVKDGELYQKIAKLFTS